MSVTVKKHEPQKSTHRENAYTPQKNALWKIFGSEFSGTTTNFDQKPQCLRLENAPFTYDTASDVHFYGKRYSSPPLGRWINRDPKDSHVSTAMMVKLSAEKVQFVRAMAELGIGSKYGQKLSQLGADLQLAHNNTLRKLTYDTGYSFLIEDPVNGIDAFGEGAIQCSIAAALCTASTFAAIDTCLVALIPDPGEPVEVPACLASLGASIGSCGWAYNACICDPEKQAEIRDMQKRIRDMQDQINKIMNRIAL